MRSKSILRDRRAQQNQQQGGLGGFSNNNNNQQSFSQPSFQEQNHSSMNNNNNHQSRYQRLPRSADNMSMMMMMDEQQQQQQQPAAIDRGVSTPASNSSSSSNWIAWTICILLLFVVLMMFGKDLLKDDESILMEPIQAVEGEDSSIVPPTEEIVKSLPLLPDGKDAPHQQQPHLSIVKSKLVTKTAHVGDHRYCQSVLKDRENRIRMLNLALDEQKTGLTEERLLYHKYDEQWKAQYNERLLDLSNKDQSILTLQEQMKSTIKLKDAEIKDLKEKIEQLEDMVYAKSGLISSTHPPIPQQQQQQIVRQPQQQQQQQQQFQQVVPSLFGGKSQFFE